jgi:NTP pyrophosphatase (non-canonical NTP hydrolase)
MDDRYLPQTPEGRLWHLAEECAEVIKAISKCKRFGMDGDSWMDDKEDTPTPRIRLLDELLDLRAVISRVQMDLQS